MHFGRNLDHETRINQVYIDIALREGLKSYWAAISDLCHLEFLIPFPAFGGVFKSCPQVQRPRV